MVLFEHTVSDFIKFSEKNFDRNCGNFLRNGVARGDVEEFVCNILSSMGESGFVKKNPIHIGCNRLQPTSRNDVSCVKCNLS